MIAVTGLSSVVLGNPVLDADEPATMDPTEFLRAKKSRKFMGVQDDLAVVAAGRALREAALEPAQLRERAGLYAAIGYIPFNEADIAPVVARSVSEGRFSMERFSSGGFQAAHPLLTFRCLPNMPAYHVSANFDVQGPYFVTYPGTAQLYAALEEAVVALESGAVDVALVLAVAHQRNFLVTHHFARLSQPVPAPMLRDAGACVVLERAESARARGVVVLGELGSLEIRYELHDPIHEQVAERELFEGAAAPSGSLGPAALPCALDRTWHATEYGAGHGVPGNSVVHRVLTRDHVVAQSEWRGT
jgi:3-oxoacyl-(acyl-carrier-protein) synthase